MLICGMWTLFTVRNSLLSGMKSGIAAARHAMGTLVAETERDLPMKCMVFSLVMFVIRFLPRFIMRRIGF